ncbi:putative dentin sialophosphoprotein-like [Capsicum annuum]|nr:putative dentin sialophosphoprotein-like [Capsicum annuum]
MLRSIDYTGNLRSVCLKPIPLLANLSLSHREYYWGAGKCNIAKFFEPFSALEHLHLNDMSLAAGAGVPTRLSQGLYCVKHLSISSKDLSDSDEWLLIIFVHLKSSISSESEFRFIFPSVESDDNHIPPLESLEVERFSNVTFNHLREDKLMQTNGTIPEKQLIELLLAKSPELVRMLIVPCLVEEFATVQILAELIRFQRSSPNAEVVYNLDKHPNPRPVSFLLARKLMRIDRLNVAAVVYH